MPDFEARELRYRNLVVPIRFKLANRSTWRHVYVVPREVRLIVLHSSEGSEVATGAEGLAGWSAGPSHPKDASWHLAVDCDSVTQSVEFDHIAWHAGPVNGYSIGIEQVGKAEQTRAQWDDPYSREVLRRTAQLIAALAGIHDLPIEHVTQGLATARGVCTHWDVTKDLCKGRGHWDPGPNYPMDEVLEMARAMQLDAVGL